MIIIVSDYYNNNNIINTTGDYNICEGLLKLPDNYKCISNNLFQIEQFRIYDNIVKYFNCKIEAIVTIQSTIEYLEDYPSDVKQYKFIVDIHGWDLNKYSKCHLLLPYAYCYNIFNYVKNENIYFFPHCIKHKIEFNETPVNKILLSGRGRKNANRYPMRVFFYNVSLKDKRIEYLKPDHSYRIDQNNIKHVMCGKNFIQKLNEYKACLVDDLIHYSPYIVCKFFEILSSGSLLLASLNYCQKYFEKLGFKENVHYILITKENYQEKIDYVLNQENENEINEIRRRGYELVYEYHTSEYRAKQLKDIIQNNNIQEFNDGMGYTKYYLAN